MNVSLFTNRSIAEEKIFSSLTLGVEKAEEMRKNEKVQWGFYHVLKEVEMSKQLEKRVWRRCSHWHLCVSRWATRNFHQWAHRVWACAPFFYLNSRILALNPLSSWNADSSVVFPEPKEERFLCCLFDSEAQFQYLFFFVNAHSLWYHL